MYRLSILDQSPVIEGESYHAALQRTVRLAKCAESLGFHRFWVSEHHNTRELAGASPEVLISYILANTNTIRVGSGGVMLSHYSPYKVAENFHVLSNLAPGRVDLGVGKAPGGLPIATKALQVNGVLDPSQFNARLQQLTDYLNTTEGELIVVPQVEEKPEVFLLGGSVESAKTAAQLGISYVFAQFIKGDEDTLLEETLQAYKAIAPNGTFAVGIAALAAETEEQAKALASTNKIYRVHLQSGRSLVLTTEAAATKYGEQSGESFEVKEAQIPIVAGTAEQVKAQFDKLHALGVDEFILHNPTKNEDARFQSLQLLSPQYEKVGL